MQSTEHPPSGLWTPTMLQHLYYGPRTVEKHLSDLFGSERSKQSKAYIITTNSLVEKTGLVKKVEQILGRHHAGTISKIKAHTPVQQLDEADAQISKDSEVDTLISLGGGSPIDAAKALSYRFNEKHGRYLYHIAIPTTLSAAECTTIAGYTDTNGLKKLTGSPQAGVSVILYDAVFALDTPAWLYLSTGLRALDHAVETMYQPYATEFPTKQSSITAFAQLFEYLPKYKANPTDEEVITRLQLAAFASLGLLGLNFQGGLGLDHTLGYAMGSPYGIPHGITSCISLGPVVKFKADNPAEAAQIARLAPGANITRADDRTDARAVGDAIIDLVRRLDLAKKLPDYDVGTDQIETIAERAAGQSSGKQYDQIVELVRTFY